MLSSSQIGHSIDVGLAGRRRRPPELGVGVADLVLGQPALPELRHDAHAGEPVVDHAAGRLLAVAADRIGPEGHGARLPAAGPASRSAIRPPV